MRNIYTDEAGISAPEPVSVVAALIVNPDIHWFPFMRRLREIWDHHIPSEYRHDNKHKLHNDFTFHAKNVSDGTKYPRWAEGSRLKLLQAMMAIPSEFEIPIAFAGVRRGALDWSGWPKDKKRMTPAKSDHMSAFMACIGEANRFVRTEYEGELAQIIADDNGEMREILRVTLNRLQGLPFSVESENSKEGKRTVILRADRIIDEVSFLTPRNAPFLQIVDACAFGLRRYLARQSHGEDYLHAISEGATLPKFPADWSLFVCTIDHKKLIVTPPPNQVILI
jgi:hypothetical protein